MNYRLLFFAIFLLACEKKEDFSDVRIIVHAASGLDNQNAIYHDNSKEAVEFALETVGCDGIELDVQLSSSNHLWFFHDQTLDKETREKGCIPVKDDAFLAQVEYKTLKKEKLLSLSNLPINYFQKQVLMLDVRHYDLCKNQNVDSLIFFNELANFLPFYAVLRTIPDKLGGVLLMGIAIVILALLPIVDTSALRSTFFKPLNL